MKITEKRNPIQIRRIENIFFDKWDHIHKEIKKDFWKLTLVKLITSLLEISSIVYLTLYMAFVIENEIAVEKIKEIQELTTLNINIKELTILLVSLFMVKTLTVVSSLNIENNFVVKYSAEIGKKLIIAITTDKKYTLGQMDINEKQRITDLDPIRFVLYIRNYSTLTNELFSSILIISMAAIFDIKMLITATIMFLSFFLIYKKFLKSKLKKDGILSKKIRIKELQTITKLIQLKKLLDIYGVTHKEYEKYRAAIIQREEIEGRRRIISSLPKISVEMIIVIIIALSVVTTSLYNDGKTQSLLFGIICLSIMAVRLIPTLNSMSYALSEIDYQTDSYQRVKQILILDYNNEEKTLNQTEGEWTDQKYANLSELKITNLYFKYPNQKEYIFEDFNCTIKSGEFVGIYGNSGVGKSTLIELISGILRQDKGSINYDNIPIHSNHKKWCGTIALVPQETIFYPGSIYENIIFDDSAIDYEILNKACEIARITSVMKELSLVPAEEIAVSISQTLSGGQKQRISIARALYRQPKILILDEATSALDSSTKNEIMRDLSSLKSVMTVIMVTHDKSLTSYFDRTITLG